MSKDEVNWSKEKLWHSDSNIGKNLQKLLKEKISYIPFTNPPVTKNAIGLSNPTAHEKVRFARLGTNVSLKCNNFVVEIFCLS